MISFKHILSPITEKRNLILILFIALFFSVFRLSGGGISTEKAMPVDRSSMEQSSEQLDSEPSFDSTTTVTDDFSDLDNLSPAADIAKMRGTTSGRPAAANNSNEDLLDGMRKAQPAKRAPTNSGSSSGGNSKLAEIERSLGLR